MDITERREAEEELRAERDTLQEAVDEIKTLQGILPICSYCKKIRDDEGYYHQIESYIRDHSEADFSHGICPECTKTGRIGKKVLDDDTKVRYCKSCGESIESKS